MQGVVYLRSASPAIRAAVHNFYAVAKSIRFSIEEVSTAALFEKWEAEKAKPGAKPYEVMVATDATSIAEVTYALFSKKMPVLVDHSLHETLASQLGQSVKKNPLLERIPPGEDESAVKSFFHFPETSGRIFVVEGGDGAGKQTQVKLLCDRLTKEGYASETLDYPHDAARYGALIRDLLSGRLGNIKQVNPLIFASLYGLNRHDTLPELKYWMLRGRNVILDRYMTANFGQQASKYSTDEERIAAIDTLKKFETEWLQLPEAHRVIYLNLPAEYALKAMKTDTTRKELDMHELAGIEYKNKVRDSFVWCCNQFPEWQEVKCVSEETGDRISREELHEKIFSALASEFVREV